MDRDQLLELAYEHLRQASALLRQVEGPDEGENVSTAISRVTCAGRRTRRAWWADK